MSRREGRGGRRPGEAGAGAPAGLTVSIITEHATQHVHVFPDGFVCDHVSEAQDAADWWRGMRPPPWTSPPFVMETALSCGCDLLVSGDPLALEALAQDVEGGSVMPGSGR